jgi:two-component system, chemotaxis family, CheB/CheR fusion protein
MSNSDRRERGAGTGPPPSLIVGLGASAGGIAALQSFFTQTPAASDAAYVVILHLSPEHDSRLAQVLQTSTEMPVVAVADTAKLEADHVYVISPGTSLRIADGVLAATEWARMEERRAPIDIFFRTLAEAYGAHAVGIVLTGTGADGSSGIRRLKEYGGLTIAQDPDEAEHDDMPRAAIAGGLIDYVLPIAAMPARIAAYGPVADRPAAAEGDVEAVGNRLREILTLLRARTGHDFSYYKTPTLLRRVDRRRHVHGLTDLAAYAALLKEHPDEPNALLQELLISVTNFFRDPASFAVLELKVLPALLEPRDNRRQVRAWVAGCATGEEAYSVAMLLSEAAERVADPPQLQVFATDLNGRTVAASREAFYSEADVAEVGAERLRRFFIREAGGYRVNRDLREIVLFATHNVLKDPPFSHLDLICCRNLLIYVQAAAQERLLETFHFALRPGGYLFLGASESLPGGVELFTTVDRQARIFQSRPAVRLRMPGPVLTPIPRLAERPTTPPGPGGAERSVPSQLHFQLLEQYGPPSVVITEDHRIVHMSAGAAAYLRVAAGEPTHDILRLVASELRPELRTALYHAARDRVRTVASGVPWTDGTEARLVNIEVRPVIDDDDPARGFFVVFFEPAVPDPEGTQVPPAVESRTLQDDAVWRLEQELQRLKGQLRSTIEQYETQVEEARASNEELQAVNEELRSSAEELETGKEELQSVNEELTTVNQELKIKIEELGARNNDFQNLITSTDIGTIFLDRGFRVKFASPRARDVFNLLPGDVGRPLSDITTSLVFDDVHGDISRVLARLQPIEREAQTSDGQYYLVRILPYRTTEDRIEGTVLTFQNITARRRAESDVRASEERLRLLIDSVEDYAIFTIGPEGRIASWNAGAARMFQYRGDEAIGQPFDILFTPEDREAGVPEHELDQARAAGRAEDERWHIRRDGSRLFCSGVTALLGDSDTRGFAKIARDLTEWRAARNRLEEAHRTLDSRVLERTAELEAEMREHGAAEERATELIRKLVVTQEEERARVARDLHDQVGQQLTGLRLTLERLQGHCAPDEQANAEVQRALGIAREIDTELDFLAWELRPAALDDLGLVAAVSRYVEAWTAHVGVEAEFRHTGLRGARLTREVETMLYRVVQESLNNVAKHAHASRVEVVLEQRDGAVVLVIDDDGVGFETSETPAAGLGLAGMRERAALAGAALEVESTPGQGTSVFVRARVARGAQPAEGEAG